MSRLVPAYVGLGANLGERRTTLLFAIDELRGLAKNAAIRISPFYRSAPHGPTDQPEYLNAAVSFLSDLTAMQLLGELHALEAVKGRNRADEQRWGPRTLDLDLLVFGQQSLQTATISVPHPRIAERNFVLLPLSKIAPALDIPGLGNVARLAGLCSKQGVALADD